MKKKKRPVQQASNIDIRTSDITLTASPKEVTKRTPKKHRARVYMLCTGGEGWTENDILRYCHLSSGRNYASELERKLNIQLERIDEKNPDGIGTHLRYRFACFDDVVRVIQFVNLHAVLGGYSGLSPHEATDILKLYPERHPTA